MQGSTQRDTLRFHAGILVIWVGIWNPYWGRFGTHVRWICGACSTLMLEVLCIICLDICSNTFVQFLSTFIGVDRRNAEQSGRNIEKIGIGKK